MLKVFLVEDEFTVREKMKKNMLWEEGQFKLVGEAGDGEVAYPMILETKPDLVITDIRMPFMDGLELSRLIKANRPATKIIILSGYDEFEYAKEAISIGITDYLLKPITSKKLLESMNKVKLIIEKERMEESQREKYLATEEESREKGRKQFFNELITCRYTPMELLDRAKKMGIELAAQCYNVLLIKIVLKEEAFQRYEEVRESLSKKMEEWNDQDERIVLFDRETEGWVVILKTTQAEIEALERKAISRIQKMMEVNELLSYCVGIGARINRLSEISLSFDAANKASAYRYLLSERRVIYYHQIEENILPVGQEAVSLSDIELAEFDKKTIEDFLKMGVKSQVDSFTKDYLKGIGQGVNSMLFRQYMMMDIYLNVIAFIEQLGYEKEYIMETCGDIKEMVMMIQTRKKAEAYLGELLRKAIFLRDEVSSKKYTKLLQEARDYIEQNYNNEVISLNSVAEFVHISASHFSTIFSQEMGQTFISYLTEVRMKKAKELLRCSTMKTLEIGYAVGYKDPHYFSYLFKKTQNCTPKEYRSMNRS